MNNKDKQKIITEDNFFNYPHLIRLNGFFKKYYNRETHPDITAINYFPGIRSIDLSITDKKINGFAKEKIQNLLNKKKIKGIINPSQDQFRLHYSLTFKDTNYNYHYDCEYHPRITNFAGIIYLNPNPPKDTGTTLVFPSQEIKIDNVFNRMVIYPTTVFHSLSGSFGNNLFNARMVISIFFNLIE